MPDPEGFDDYVVINSNSYEWTHPFMQQEQQEGQQQQVQQPEQLGQQQAQQPQQAQQAQRNLLQQPFMLHTVTSWLDDEAVHAYEPDAKRLETAYSEVSFYYDKSEKKKNSLKKSAEKRYDLQKELQKQINRHPRAAHSLNLKKAMGMSDASLVKHYGEQNDEASEYVRLRINLIKNYYYAMVPVDEMRKLSRDQLIQKLREEYARERRNNMLISFYQDLIRLQNIEANSAAVNAPVNRREGDKTRDNESAYQKNKQMIDAKTHIDQAQKTKRKNALKKVLKPRGEDYWSDREENDTSGLNKAEQGNRVRQILAFLYRHSNDNAKKPMESFIYQLTQAKPSQQLLFCYLIENELQMKPTTECFLAARTYTPNVEVFKDKVRKGVFSKTVEWNKISDAAHFALDKDVGGLMEDYAESERRLAGADLTLRAHHIDPDDANYANDADLGELHEVERVRYDRLIALGDMVMTMYRSAGLSPDMPPEMIRDQKLLEKVNDIAHAFMDELLKLSKTQRKIAELDGAQAQQEGEVVKRGDETFKEQGEQIKDAGPAKKKFTKSSLDKLQDAKKAGLDQIVNADRLLKAIKFDWTKSGTYIETSGYATAGVSLVGIVASIWAVCKLARGGAKTLSYADITARSLGVAGDLINNSVGLGKSVFSIIDQYKNLGTLPKGETWLGNTTVMTAQESFSTVAGTVQFVAGGLQIIGGLLTIGSGAIEYRRGKSNLENVRDANTAADNLLNAGRDDATLRDEIAGEEQQLRQLEEQGRQQQGRQQQQPINIEQRKNELRQSIAEKKRQLNHRANIRALMKHQKKKAEIQKKSATMTMLSGSITTVGGVLLMTGILAPIGGILGIAGSLSSIAVNMIYARKKKKQAKKDSVDEAIRLEDALAEAKRLYGLNNLTKKDEENLRNQLRMEILAELHYATWKDCFHGLARENAVMIYNTVFGVNGQQPDTDTDEYRMYYNTMLSLGYNEKDVKRATSPGEKTYPTLEDIYARLMA